MSKLYKNITDKSNSPNEMTEINDFNHSTIGYCVIFQK